MTILASQFVHSRRAVSALSSLVRSQLPLGFSTTTREFAVQSDDERRACSTAASAGPSSQGVRDGSQPRVLPREALDIFDRNLVRRHRDRAAFLGVHNDPLQTTVTERLLDRLEDCMRKFPTVLVLGGAAEQVISQLAGQRAGVERVIYVDTSTDMLARVRAAGIVAAASGGRPWPTVQYVQADEEFLPLKPHSVDCMAGEAAETVADVYGCSIGNMAMGQGAMTQCQHAMRPDCLFLAAMFGGETLNEMRIACSLAQMEREGGVSPIVSPLAEVRDCGNLLSRAGLTMPAVDVDSFKVGYPSPMEVVQHLRAMGETNAVVDRRRLLKRETAIAASALYRSMFGEDDGVVTATFQVIYMTGWSPHPSQPKAAKRGSGTVSFKELAAGLTSQGAKGGHS